MARDAVGTRCHLPKHGRIQRACENTVIVLCYFPSKKTLYEAETFALLHVTFIVSL